jgi:hypothetical protein
MVFMRNILPKYFGPINPDTRLPNPDSPNAIIETGA